MWVELMFVELLSSVLIDEEPGVVTEPLTCPDPIDPWAEELDWIWPPCMEPLTPALGWAVPLL